jgi:hypothetical protein
MSRRGIARAIVASCVFLPARSAVAQVHADIDLEGGPSARFVSGRPSSALFRQAGASNPDVGPTIGMSAHVTLLPFVRAGAYVSHDFSPISGADLREITSAGLSMRLFSPWPRGVVRVWFALGFGYAAAYAPSYTATMAGPGGTAATALVSGTAGGFFEVPMGVGASVRIAPNFELVGDVGARIGFDFAGNMYNRGPTASASGLPTLALPAAGDDVVAVFLVVGAAFEL